MTPLLTENMYESDLYERPGGFHEPPLERRTHQNMASRFFTELVDNILVHKGEFKRGDAEIIMAQRIDMIIERHRAEFANVAAHVASNCFLATSDSSKSEGGSTAQLGVVMQALRDWVQTESTNIESSQCLVSDWQWVESGCAPILNACRVWHHYMHPHFTRIQVNMRTLTKLKQNSSPICRRERWEISSSMSVLWIRQCYLEMMQIREIGTLAWPVKWMGCKKAKIR